VLDVKFTDLGIEIRARDEIDAGLKKEDIVDCAYPPSDPRRYGVKGDARSAINT
jgi:hypothetical protein